MRNKSIKEQETIVNPPVTDIPSGKTPGVLFGVIIGVLLCSTTILAYMVLQGRRQTSPVSTPVQKYPPQASTERPTFTYISPTPRPTLPPLEKKDFGAVNWLQFPKVVEKIDVLAPETSYNTNGCYRDTAKFHQIGTFSDGSDLINMFIDCDGMGGPYNYLYRLIISPSGEMYFNGRDDMKLFNSRVKNIQADIKGLIVPDNIRTTKGNLVGYSPMFTAGAMSFTELKNPVFFEKSDYGDIYVIYTEIAGDESLKGKVMDKFFYLRLKDDTIASYEMKADFMGDDNIPKIVWADSTINKDQFFNGISRGCGGKGGRILDPSMVSSRVQIGTAEGLPIYQISDINNLINKTLFDLAYFEEGKKLTPQELVNAKNHFVWQDGSGDWTLFVNSKFESPAECGKPVIYLYPEKETQVSVKVGASISKSEPLYPQNGWEVLAKPSGELIYQGQSYPYLFWEGLGLGTYPNYQNRGSVVPQKDLVSTVYSHLSQLGLNNEESADFMEFWQAKLPKTPYVRLTWLMTEDMDKLAPLSVSPKPESYIRIFLEFEGLEKPVKLVPQKLTAKTRNGFTLVEWGGLLNK